MLKRLKQLTQDVLVNIRKFNIVKYDILWRERCVFQPVTYSEEKTSDSYRKGLYFTDVMMLKRHLTWTHHICPNQAAKDAQKKMPPSEMFRVQTDKYSQFDENVCFVLTSFPHCEFNIMMTFCCSLLFMLHLNRNICLKQDAIRNRECRFRKNFTNPWQWDGLWWHLVKNKTKYAFLPMHCFQKMKWQ